MFQALSARGKSKSMRPVEAVKESATTFLVKSEEINYFRKTE